MTSTASNSSVQNRMEAKPAFFVALLVFCFLAMLTIVILGAASQDLFQFLLWCSIFFTGLCLVRPLSGRALAGERESFLSSVLVIWVFLMISEAIFVHNQTTASAATWAC